MQMLLQGKRAAEFSAVIARRVMAALCGISPAVRVLVGATIVATLLVFIFHAREPEETEGMKREKIRVATEVRRFEGHNGAVWCVAVSADSQYILSGGEDETVRLWDLSTGKETRRLLGHTKAVRYVLLTPDNQQAFSCAADNTIRMWDLKNGREIRQHVGHPSFCGPIRISQDGSFLISNGDWPVPIPEDQSILARVWNTNTGNERFPVIARANVFAQNTSIFPDGERAMSHTDCGLLIWELKTGRPIRSINQELRTRDIALPALKPSWMVTTNQSKLEVRSVDTGRIIRTWRANESSVLAIATSPTHPWVLSGGGQGRNRETAVDCTARLWDLEKGQELCCMSGHTGAVTSVAFTPDGKYAVTGSTDKTLRLWELPIP